MTMTLADLKNQCRYRTDMTDSEFVSDVELTTFINGSITELHDILIQSYGTDYYVKSEEFNTISQQADYSINTIVTDNDFYKLLGLDAKINGSEWTTLTPFNFNERNRFQRSGVWDRLGITNIRYRLIGDNIRLAPAPNSSIQCKLWYIPLATQLVEDTDELTELNQYADYIIVDTAIKMLQKEESDVSIFMAQKVALKKRIEEAAQNRDAGKSESISDIHAEFTDWWY